MEAIINNFRTARHHQDTRHIIISIDGYDTKEKAGQLVGKRVVWKSSAGKELRGEIARVHGNKGRVRAIFEKGLPGQALGTKAEVI